LECKVIIESEKQPQRCKDIENKWKLQELLGGNRWDYFKELDEWQFVDDKI
jgi:hypothetical protein